MADNLSIAKKFYEAWNERDFDVLVSASTDESELVIVGTGDVFRGPEGARRYNENWANGFPDGRVTVDHILAAGDTVVVEYTGRGTHTGTLSTSMGDIPATGRTLTLKLCDIIEFRDEKVVRQRSYFDSGSMMAQLGLTAGQTATATS